MARIVKVKSLPRKKTTTRNSLQILLGEFYESDAIFGKYEYSENNYVDVHSAANALRVAAKRGKFPIKIHQRGNEVYLEKVRV